jgi:hypothetical protein
MISSVMVPLACGMTSPPAFAENPPGPMMVISGFVLFLALSLESAVIVAQVSAIKGGKFLCSLRQGKNRGWL